MLLLNCYLLERGPYWEDKGHSFPNSDRPTPVNNMFIFPPGNWNMNEFCVQSSQIPVALALTDLF